MKVSDSLFYWILMVVVIAPMVAIAVVNNSGNED